MDQIDVLSELLPLLVPIAILQLGLMVAALLDLSRRSSTNGPKWLWVIIILFVNMIGPVLYFLVGRKEE